MRRIIMIFVAIAFLVAGCGNLPDESAMPPDEIYEDSDSGNYYEYAPDAPFTIVPRAEWSDFYGDEFFFNRYEYIEALFESARSVTTRFESSPFTTMHIIEPYEHELVEPWFELHDEIIINGEIINAPSPVWMHLALGGRFIGHYHGAEVYLEVSIPVIMVPLREVAEALGYEVTCDIESGEIAVVGAYRLWLGESIAYNVAYEWQIFMAAQPVIYNEMIFVSPDLFMLYGIQIFDSQFVISRYSLNRLGEIVIGIALATDESMASYSSFAEFIEHDPETPHFQQLIITPNMPLYDFRWFETGLGVYEFYYYNIDIYEAGEITPTRPFIVSYRPGGTFPHRGISFVDYNGVTRYFTLNTNEADFSQSQMGRYVLWEFLPGVPLW